MFAEGLNYTLQKKEREQWMKPFRNTDKAWERNGGRCVHGDSIEAKNAWYAANWKAPDAKASDSSLQEVSSNMRLGDKLSSDAIKATFATTESTSIRHCSERNDPPWRRLKNKTKLERYTCIFGPIDTWWKKKCFLHLQTEFGFRRKAQNNQDKFTYLKTIRYILNWI